MKSVSATPFPHLDEVLYQRFRELILARTGMWIGSRRRDVLARTLDELSSTITHGNLDDYHGLLVQTRTDHPLWDSLVEKLTVGETYFFRDKNQIRVLREHILPRIISNHREDRSIRIWSAGCATGEEPYTLAMLVTELIGGSDQWRLSILGTDIHKQALHRAGLARYRPWSFRQTDPRYQSRFFRLRQEEYELLPVIREKVQFSYLNLKEPSYPSPDGPFRHLDLILCRNVAIYYPEAIVGEMVDRFSRCLNPGGWLMVGAAETSIPVFNALETCQVSGCTVFQKPAGGSIREQGNGRFTGVQQNRTATAWTGYERPVSVGRNLLQSGKTEPAKPASDQIRHPIYDKASEILKTCMTSDPKASDPKDIENLYLQARIHADKGEFEMARSLCEQVLTEDPCHPGTHLVQGLICHEQGDLDSAAQHLKRVLFLDGHFVLAHFYLAIILGKLGHSARADHHKKQAVKLASKLDPSTVLAGSDDVTAGAVISMARMMRDG